MGFIGGSARPSKEMEVAEVWGEVADGGGARAEAQTPSSEGSAARCVQAAVQNGEGLDLERNWDLILCSAFIH